MLFTKIPESYTGQALYYAANHPWLNPPQVICLFGKGCKPRGLLDKLIRYTARLFFIMLAGAICPLYGAIRHSIYAHRYWAVSLREENQKLKLEIQSLARLHLQAAKVDVQGVSCILIAPKYAWSLDENIEVWFSSTDAYVPETQEGNVNTIKDYPWEIVANDGPNQVVEAYKNLRLAYATNDLIRVKKLITKDSGLKRYKILGCQAYPYNQLKKFCLDLRMKTGYNPGINHSQVLRGVRIEIWNQPRENPPFFPEVNTTNRNYLRFKTGKDSFYSVPWKSIALVVSALVICFLIGVSLYTDYLTNYLGESILAISKKNYILAGLPIAFLKFARKLEIEQRNKEQQIVDEGIIQGNLGDGIAWYGKAAMNGYAPAQRIYGLATLLCLKENEIENMNEQDIEELDEGLKWLCNAAKNGDGGALEDCRLLMGGSFPENHIFRIETKARLKVLIGNRDIRTIAKSRLMEKLGILPRYSSFVSVFVRSMIKKRTTRLYSYPLS